MRRLVVADATAVAEVARERIRAAAAEAIVARGRFALALTGGSTPRDLYRRLRGDDLEWSATWAALGDERHVSAGDADANMTMIRESLLDHVGPASVLAPPPADEVPDVAEAAAAYARRLEAAFGGVPHFDLVLLGMGADGHTASLFPGDEAALSATGITTPGRAPVAPHDRVSLTFPVLNAGREVLVLVSGEAKREALARVEAGADLPAARLTTATFVVDRAAAGAD